MSEENDKTITDIVEEALKAEGPLGYDDLMELTGLTKNQVRNALNTLKLKGKARQVARGVWEAGDLSVGALFEYIGIAGDRMVVRHIDSSKLFTIEPM